MLVLQFVLGTCLGSFFYATYSRRLAGQTVFRPARSQCDSCAETIEWYFLIPIVSYIILRGHCRWCGQRIPKSNLLSEIFFGILMLCWTPTLTGTLNIVIGTLLYFMALDDRRSLEFPATYCWLLMMVAVTVHCLSQPTNPAVIYIVLIWFVLQFFDLENRYIGSGDIDVLLALFILHGLNALAWLLLISCATAMIASFIIKRKTLPFLPFITFSYLCQFCFMVFG